MKINVRKTLENTVTVPDEFPFYVEELTSSDEMPTLLGLADEKYTYSEMDDEFFDFVSRKINDDGVYIRLIHIIVKETDADCLRSPACTEYCRYAWLRRPDLDI